MGLYVNSFCDTEGLNRVRPPSSQAKLATTLLGFPSTLLAQAPAFNTDEVFIVTPWKVQNLVSKSVFKKYSFPEQQFSFFSWVTSPRLTLQSHQVHLL